MSERRLLDACPGLSIRHEGADVTSEIVLTDGRANPFGWSQYRLVRRQRAGLADVDTPIGWLESGYAESLEPGYVAVDARP